MERGPEFHGSLAALATKRKQLLAIRQVQYQRNYQEKSLLEDLFQQNEDMFTLLHNLLQVNAADLKRIAAERDELKRYVRDEVSSVKDAERVAIVDLKRYVREEVSNMKDAERVATGDLKRYVREEIASAQDAERVATADLKRYVCEEISKAKRVERPTATPQTRIPPISLKEMSPFTTERTHARAEHRIGQVQPRVLASSFAGSPKRKAGSGNFERLQPLELAKRKGDDNNIAKFMDDSPTAKAKAQDPRKNWADSNVNDNYNPRKFPFESEDPALPPATEVELADEEAESDGNNCDDYLNNNMSDGDMVTQLPSAGSVIVKQEPGVEEPYDELANGPRDPPPNNELGDGAGPRIRQGSSKDSSGTGSEGRLKRRRRRKRPRLSLLELQPEPALDKSLENDNDNKADDDELFGPAKTVVKEEVTSIPNTPERPRRNQEESISIPETPELPRRNNESISIPETPEHPRRSKEPLCIPETPEPSTSSKKKKKPVYIPETPEPLSRLPISKKKQAALRRKSLPPKTPVATSTTTTTANGNANGSRDVQGSVNFNRTAPSPRGLVFEGFRTPADVHREVRRKATEQKRKEMGYAAKETVLGHARQALQGFVCHECEPLLNAEAAADENPEERRKQLLKHCKHRARKPPPQTPPDYWKLSFDETMTQPPPTQTQHTTPARKPR